MKKSPHIVAIAAILLFAIPTHAQFCWGIKGGANLGNNNLTILKEEGRMLNIQDYTKFFIGPKAEVRIPIIGLSLELSALYAQQGIELPNNETFKHNSLQIPFNVKYIFGLGNKANLFVTAGPGVDLSIGKTSRVAIDLRNNGITDNIKGYLSEHIVKKANLCVNVGLGVTLLNHLQMGINYNMPWSKTGEFIPIAASEIGNVKAAKDNRNVTIDNCKMPKAQNVYDNIKSGIVQVSTAYLF